MTTPPLTLRDRLARVTYEDQTGDTWAEVSEYHRAMHLGMADAVLALLAAEPVSEEAVDAFDKILWKKIQQQPSFIWGAMPRMDTVRDGLACAWLSMLGQTQTKDGEGKG